MLETSTGSRIPAKFARNKPPKPPILPSTCGPCVCLHERLDVALQAIAEIDIDARARVGFFLFDRFEQVDANLAITIKSARICANPRASLE